MISSELPEVLHVGDRILVMREGRLAAEFGHADASEEKIMAAATGQLAGAGRHERTAVTAARRPPPPAPPAGPTSARAG